MLQEGGFTLETVPSLQTCKDEAILVQSKGVKTLYFTVSPRATAWDLVEEDQGEEVEERSFINEAEQRRLEESYRHCLRLREGFYQISSYRHCCSCLGLFMPDMGGLKMGCKHYLCDSCVAKTYVCISSMTANATITQVMFAPHLETTHIGHEEA